MTAEETACPPEGTPIRGPQHTTSENSGREYIKFSHEELENPKTIIEDALDTLFDSKAIRKRRDSSERTFTREEIVSWALDALAGTKFITLDDTKHIFYQKDGVYERAESLIESVAQKNIGIELSNYFIEEIKGQIRRKSYIIRNEINKDRTRIPLKNGLFNLETFTLEPFDEKAIFTYRIPITYDPAATCPAIEAWVKEIAEEDSFALLQEWSGYTFEPDYPLHITLWLYGIGRNGKGSFIRLLSKTLGINNVTAVPLEQFSPAYKFALMRLFGSFLNVCSEPSTRRVLETETFKKVSGGDQIDGEVKGRQETIPFTAFCKVLIMGNGYPNIEDDTPAFWERIQVVKFPNSYVGDADIKKIEERKIQEDGGEEKALAGFFNWCMIGLKRLKANGYVLTKSRSCEATKIEFQKISNSIRAFIGEFIILKPTGRYPRVELYENYKQYCNIYELTVKSKKDFTMKMGELRGVHISKQKWYGEAKELWMGIEFDDEKLKKLQKLNDVDLVYPNKNEENSENILITSYIRGVGPSTSSTSSTSECTKCHKICETIPYNDIELCEDCFESALRGEDDQ